MARHLTDGFYYFIIINQFIFIISSLRKFILYQRVRDELRFAQADAREATYSDTPRTTPPSLWAACTIGSRNTSSPGGDTDGEMCSSNARP